MPSYTILYWEQILSINIPARLPIWYFTPSDNMCLVIYDKALYTVTGHSFYTPGPTPL